MYPSTISTFNQVSPTDRLNSPSHSALHNSVSSVLTQVQTVLGTNVASAIGTVIGDLRNPASDGGGHIQTAVKGGTGQTTFTKGDLFVATGPSVISKFAASSTVGHVLTAAPGESAGMKWSNVVANKVDITTNISSIYNNNTELVLFAASVAGSTLGTNNAIKFTGIMSPFWWEQGAFTLKVKYGDNTVLNIPMTVASGAIASVAGFVQGVIVGNTSVTSQKSFGQFFAVNNKAESSGDLTVTMNKIMATGFGTSSVNSSAEQNLVITGQFANAAVANSVLGQMFVVEKIV